jgi:hypothetical protein
VRPRDDANSQPRKALASRVRHVSVVSSIRHQCTA